jgi:hypothetical protein
MAKDVTLISAAETSSDLMLVACAEIEYIPISDAIKPILNKINVARR